MIKTASTAWKTSLRTGSLADRDYRLYADFRQKEYPDLGTGSAQYTVVREDNLFDRGNCSSPIPPMIFGETVPVLNNATFARSSAQAHTGDYSYLFTKTSAAGAGIGRVNITDNFDVTDMHGTVAGSAYGFSAWTYIPTVSGVAVSEVQILISQSIAGAALTLVDTMTATTLDAWENLTSTFTLDVAATGFTIQIRAATGAALNEYFYIDDLKLTSHTVPGSHALTGGYAEYLLPMPDTFNFEIKAKANFAYDVASNQYLFGWYIDATHYLKYHYNATTDKYELEWKDGTAARILTSSAYTVTCLLDAWIIHSFALDFTTGDTTGSQMWIDKYTTDLFWSDNSDVKSSVFNKMQVRAFNGTAGNHDIAYARFFDATAEQEIEANLVGYWPLNEGAGTVAADNSGYGGHGAITAGTGGWTDGVSRKAYNFSDSQILIPDSTSYNFGAGDFTLYWWMKSDDTPGITETIAVRSAALVGITIQFTTAERVYCYTSNAGDVLTFSDPITDQGWHCIIFERASGVQSVYVDNDLQRSTNSTKDIDVSAVLRIGTNGGGNNFDGPMDEWRFYNYALSSSERTTLYTDYVIAHTGSIATDFKSTKDEEIFFDFNGHGTGRTRVNISTPASRTLTKYDLYKGITSRLNASYGTNTLNCTLRNDDGRFSDDQNAAWDPANSVYNGTNAQNYLQQRFGVELESWYSNDFDTVFLGRSVEGGLSRTSKMKTVSTVNLSAEDGVGDLDRSFEENGRVFPSSMLVRSDTLIDRGGCQSTTNPCMIGELSAAVSDATFGRQPSTLYMGRYSYEMTKAVAAGTAAWVYLADNASAGDMHGLLAAKTYTLSMKVYIPSGEALGSEIIISLVDSAGSTTQAATNVYDSWQHVTVTRTLDAGATYAYPQIEIASAADNGEHIHVADIKLVPGDLSEATDNSLFHKIAKRGYRKTIQYLSNNSFENADITLSWLVSDGGTLNRDAADGFFGSVSGELIPGAAEEYAYQQVTFLLTRKLNVGDKFNFSCYLKSTAAATGANNYLRLYEKTSPSTNNAYTDESYTLAGGEGYKRCDVTHTITTSTSNLLQVEIWADAGDTINIDGAMLTPTEEALNYFIVNALNGTAGVSLADLGVEISYPWHGFKTHNVDYIHPWRRMDQNTTVWQNIKSVGAGTGARYCGMDESGALVNYSILDNDFTDAVPIGELTDVSTDLNYARHDGISISLDALSANKLYGSGDKYEVGTVERLIWLASSTGNFAESTADQQLAESVLASAYWPNPDDYAEYWAEYGSSPDKAKVGTDLTLVPMTGTFATVYGKAMEFPGTPLYNKFNELFYKQPPVSKRDRIVGIQSAKLIHKTTDAGDGDGNLSYVTAGLLSSGLDLTSKAGQARILLQNETAGTLILVDAGIVGKAVYKFTGSEGFIHDGYIDRADIAKNGERLITFGGEDVIDGAPNGQLDRLADFIWKDRGTRKHLYVIATVGAPHDLSPADWINLDIGAAGTAENIASLAEVQGMRISQSADSRGTTQTTCREVEEGWKYDSSAVSRFLARGVNLPTFGGSAFVTVGSEYLHANTDIRIPNASTTAEVQINAAIDFLSNNYGGGEVRLARGTYTTSSPIILKSNIALSGEGAGTIISREGTFIPITATGGSGTELTNIIVRGLSIVRTATGTPTAAIRFEYTDDSAIENVKITGDDLTGIQLSYCDRGNATGCTFALKSASAFDSGGNSLDWNITNCSIVNARPGLGGGTCITNTNGVVSGNTIWTQADTAITSSCGTVANNVITAVGSALGITIPIVGTDDNVTISGNSISGITGELAGYGIKINNNVQNATVIGNTISGMVSTNNTGAQNWAGIWTQGDKGLISNNVITGIAITYDGTVAGINIVSGGDGNTITNNTISSIDIDDAGNSDDVWGIYVGGSHTQLRGNLIKDITITNGSGSAYGIIMVGNSAGNASENDINTVDDYGIYITDDFCTANGNTVSSCDVGIEVAATADRILILNNDVYSSGSNDFVNNGTNVVIA